MATLLCGYVYRDSSPQPFENESHAQTVELLRSPSHDQKWRFAKLLIALKKIRGKTDNSLQGKDCNPEQGKICVTKLKYNTLSYLIR
jgi:hypothetical protein